MKNQKGFISIGVIGIILLAVVVGGYFVFVRHMEVAIAPTPGTNQTADQMADWQTYTNVDLGFELRIPEYVSIDKVLNDDYNRMVVFKSTRENFEVRLKSDVTTSLNSYFYLDFPVSSRTTLGGKEALVFEAPKGYCDGPSCGNPFIAYSAKNSNDFYNLVFYGDAKLSSTEQTILSTFKFTNSSVNNWKTYTNTKYGYEFRYPANTEIQTMVNAKFGRPTTGNDDNIYIGGLIDINMVNALGKCSDLRTEQAIKTCLGSVSWAQQDHWIPITIGGLPGVRREITLKPTPVAGSDIAPVGYIYYVNNGKIGFQISFADSIILRPLMEQILSTFKFTK